MTEVFKMIHGTNKVCLKTFYCIDEAGGTRYNKWLSLGEMLD